MKYSSKNLIPSQNSKKNLTRHIICHREAFFIISWKKSTL